MSTRKGRFQPNGNGTTLISTKYLSQIGEKADWMPFGFNQSFLFSSSRILTAIS